MTQHLKPTYWPLDGFGWGGILILFISSTAFLAMAVGGWLWAPGWLAGAVVALIPGACGLVTGWAGARALLPWVRFGLPSAAVTPCPVTLGRTFTVCCEQPLRVPARVQRVLVVLVVRETWTSGGPDGEERRRHADRLVQSVEFSGRNYPRGARVKCESSFQLPSAFLQELNRGDAPLKWLIKVRLDLATRETYWQEYALPVAAEAAVETAGACGAPGAPGAEAPVTPRFDLVLWRPGDHLRMEAVLSELAPHLRTWEIAGPSARLPSVVLEGASEAEAREAAAKLEGTGAKVEIRFAVTSLVPERRRVPAPPTELAAAAAPEGRGDELSPEESHANRHRR